MAWQLDDGWRAIPVVDDGTDNDFRYRRDPPTRSPYLRIRPYHHWHPSYRRPSHSAPSSATPTSLANDTTTPTPTPTPQLPISKVTLRSHHLPHDVSVLPRRCIVLITEESREKHKAPRGVVLRRNHRQSSSLMGGPSIDFACIEFPLILLACERTVGCTDALPV
jgi:hypothetical protein